jgi:hypothetical protein
VSVPVRRKACQQRAVVAYFFAGIVACGRADKPDSLRLVGTWTKLDDKLPPVSAEFTPDSSGLRVRLRFSGREQSGTGTLKGSALTLQFPGGTMNGTLVSDTVLELVAGDRAAVRLVRQAR